nr:hypothetical protein [uncultured Celeribacter sp.]
MTPKRLQTTNASFIACDAPCRARHREDRAKVRLVVADRCWCSAVFDFLGERYNVVFKDRAEHLCFGAPGLFDAFEGVALDCIGKGATAIADG